MARTPRLYHSYWPIMAHYGPPTLPGSYAVLGFQQIGWPSIYKLAAAVACPPFLGSSVYTCVKVNECARVSLRQEFL